MHDIDVGPICGDGAVCMTCGSIVQYDTRLELIASDASADRRWQDEAPNAHEVLHHMSGMAMARLRTAEDIAQLVRRWKPGAGQDGEQG